MMNDEAKKLLEELFAPRNNASNVNENETNEPTEGVPGATSTRPLSPRSAELLEWLETREYALKRRAAMSEDGIHIMLKDSVIDPMELPEPLRTEAIEYLRQQDGD